MHEQSPNQPEVKTPHNQIDNGRWFMENGMIFVGSKVARDSAAEHIKAELEKKQFNYEASINKASDRPLMSREEVITSLGVRELIREIGFFNAEFTSLAAGTAARLAESYESGDLKDSSDAKEKAKLHRGVVDLLDSESNIGSTIEQHLARLESRLETYRDNRIPHLTAGVEWKIKVALQAKEILEEQKEDFEDRAKDIANGENWELQDTHGDIGEARKILADEWTTYHNKDLIRRRDESSLKKREVNQNARTTAARSDVVDLSGESDVPKTVVEAEVMINSSPDLMIELLAEAHNYADKLANTTEDLGQRGRYQKEIDQLDEITKSFNELARLWRAQGSGKPYRQFYEELNDTNTDRTVMFWLANASPALIDANSFVQIRKLAMAKRISNPSA